MKIKEVTVEGYQSHVNSVFQLSPGLTVITGPSDAGKTAIIRALRWFAFNEPTGEAFLHTVRNPDGSVKEIADQVKVSVTFDNGVTITKTRRKGKTAYTHSAYPEPWEKAEVPPEIKETLGLVKQKYGDFDTCLNFAFQLDAPFLLSETASVGAKVLGKLAGTEVVDKSISEVNKKTHNTRTTIAYLEKQIGEIDVSLTEYFDLDTHDQALTAVEAVMDRIQGNKERYNRFVSLMSAYEVNTERRIQFFDEAERLSGVVVLSVQLERAERSEKKRSKLSDLEARFWSAVHATEDPAAVLRKTQGLSGIRESLESVIDRYCRRASLNADNVAYQKYSRIVNETADLIVRLDQGIGLRYLLDMAVESHGKQTRLSTLLRANSTAGNAVKVLRDKLQGFEGLNAIRGKYEALEGQIERLDDLQRLNAVLTSRELSRDAAKKQVYTTAGQVIEAKKELQDAWDAAGGVCPLCGSEVSGCTH